MLGGCSETHTSFLNPQGPIALAQRHQFFLVIALTLIVVLPVLLLTPWLVSRYRYGRRADYRPHWGFSKSIDVAIWGIPSLLVVVLAVIAWRSTLALAPYRPLSGDDERAPLHVQVVGFDWKWLFIYPDEGIATVNQLVIPTGRDVSLELTSASVMQGFFIPALGSQIDVMNRMVTRLHLKAFESGEFEGKNMQYNGKGFHHQRFTGRAVSAAAFDSFVAGVRRHGRALDRQVFTDLKARSTGDELARALELTTDELRFAPVPPDLFDTVAAHERPAWQALSQNREVSP